MLRLIQEKNKSKGRVSNNSSVPGLLKKTKATLSTGDLSQLVRLPKNIDIDEWLAINTIDFFNQINLIYGSITEFCTPRDCPTMSAGPKHEYMWFGDKTLKKPVRCSAPEYFDYSMTWVQSKLDNETIFPSRTDVPFPKNFFTVIKSIYKVFTYIYAHIYCQHIDRVFELGEEVHINTSFKHFYYFVTEFSLVDKSKFSPLADVIQNLIDGKKSIAARPRLKKEKDSRH
ncbi:MOB kinase activator 1A-like [Schistocerca gregaria]|uniref:MOB kinase activator 1A-like n=1 Tax=Schistocerca gregaria TaxID=7010 RepID=UPI00211E6543|nr:MOB kinase activator 1A-like [Schistocerca gregaria]